MDTPFPVLKLKEFPWTPLHENDENKGFSGRRSSLLEKLICMDSSSGLSTIQTNNDFPLPFHVLTLNLEN